MRSEIRCPDCGSETVLRTVRKGPDAGQRFRVCVRYPDCGGRMPVAGSIDDDCPDEVEKEGVRRHIETPGKLDSENVKRGRFGEPYCSEKCCQEAGVRINAASAKGVQGVCVVCRSQVKFGPGKSATNCIAIPYQGKVEAVFVCEKCLIEGRQYVAGIKKCCMCGRPV